MEALLTIMERDTYIALFSHFIPCGVWEAHADTQGAECTAACDLECIRGRSAVKVILYLP